MWTCPHYSSLTQPSPTDKTILNATNHLESTTGLDPPSSGASVCVLGVDFNI